VEATRKREASGYTYERLKQMAKHTPAIGMILDEIQVLIDGPYVAKLAESAGPWTGSGNQRNRPGGYPTGRSGSPG
jgi:hypothetical protein